MTRTLNEGWIPDYTNSNEEKWVIWFDLSSGSGLSLCGIAYTSAYTSVGSRLVFRTKALAMHAVEHFLPEYADHIIIQPSKQ